MAWREGEIPILGEGEDREVLEPTKNDWAAYHRQKNLYRRKSKCSYSEEGWGACVIAGWGAGGEGGSSLSGKPQNLHQ